MANYLRNHLWGITLIILLFTIIAPRLFTLPGFDCLDLSETGQVGDTIGGITAPFLGFLSVILLYITLKEQQESNRIQQFVSESNLLISLRSNISECCDNLEIPVIFNSSNPGKKIVYQDSFNIEKLRSSKYPQYAISEEDFERLHRSCCEIAELCLLYYHILISFSLNKNINKDVVNFYFQSVRVYSERICLLFTSYAENNIKITKDKNSVCDDISQKYADVYNEYITRFGDIYKSLK